MKLIGGIIVATLAAAAPALAQDQAAPAATPAAPAATATKYSLDTPVEALIADPVARAVLTASLPDIDKHPSYEMFKGMSLNQLAPMAPDKLTPEKLEQVKIGLAALK